MITKFFKSRIGKNSLWMLSGNIIQLIVQVIFFVLLARVLGVGGFGFFSTILAASMLLSPFVNLGFGSLIIKEGSREKAKIPSLLISGYFFVFVLGIIGALLLILFRNLLFNIETSIVILINFFISNLILANIISLNGFAFQAIEKLKITSLINIITSLIRLVFLMFFIFLGLSNIYTWSYYYFLSSIVSMIISFIFIFHNFKIVTPKITIFFNMIKEGLLFSISQFSRNVYTDIDKIMLSKMINIEATGIYTLAYRFLGYAYLPISSILSASSPSFFKAGEKGLKSCISNHRNVFFFVVIYGSAASIILYLLAPIIPYVLGNGYNNSVDLLKIMSIVILLQSIHYSIADILTTSGYHGYRTIVQIAVVFLNIFLNLIFIPIYSIKGAVYSTIISESLLLIALLIVLLVMIKRE